MFTGEYKKCEILAKIAEAAAFLKTTSCQIQDGGRPHIFNL